MAELHPINRTLLAILDNQVARTACAFAGLNDQVYRREPGGDCKSIAQIGAHLVHLRRFQLTLLGSPLADEVADPQTAGAMANLLDKLEQATRLFRQAIEDHDPDDWFCVPDPPRQGRWGDEPTLVRISRPLNDLTNHLGAIRAIRRILGELAAETQ